MPSREDLDSQIDAVYELPLDGFVEARNALAATLRKAGRKDDAARVRDLDKPSVTAWAVNQVWWKHRRTFEAMLDAGTRLRDVQQASLKGEGGNLREAVEARQDAIGAVVDRAVDAMGGGDRVSPAMRQRLGATCDALATGNVPEGTRLGRLTQDLQPAGFGALAAMLPLVSAAGPAAASPPSARERGPATVTPFPARGKAAAAPAAEGTRGRKEPEARARDDAAERARAASAAEAQAAVHVAERELREAEDALEERDTAKAEAARAFDAAEQRVADIERELDEARRAESAARAALNEAKRAAVAAEAARERARATAERARTKLKNLA
jgi:hypothetical protein